MVPERAEVSMLWSGRYFIGNDAGLDTLDLTAWTNARTPSYLSNS
ncbi:hypothetical protein RSAG8_01736, partial [Rhizoctonia solani AG-8 WAC10335]